MFVGVMYLDSVAQYQEEVLSVCVIMLLLAILVIQHCSILITLVSKWIVV